MDQSIFTARHKSQKPKYHFYHTKNSKSESITNSKSESIIQSSSTSLVQEQIREYLKKDQEKRLPKLKLKFSRDISYIKDSKFSKLQHNQVNLPRTLSDLKNIDSCKSFSQICIKPSCITELLSSRSEAIKNPVKYLESLSKSVPSGRKEAENLLSWFIYMKSKYEADPEFELVIWKCAEELCRQISVDCKERGELFKVVFGYFQGIFDAKAEDIRNYCEGYEQICKKKIVKLQVHHFEEMEKLRNKNEELMNEIKSKDEEIGKVMQEMMIYKKRFYKMHRDVKENKIGVKKININGEVKDGVRKGRVHKTELVPQSYNTSRASSISGSYAPSNNSFYGLKSPMSIQILDFYKDKCEQTEINECKDKSIQIIHDFTLSHQFTIPINPAPVILKSLRINKFTQTVEPKSDSKPRMQTFKSKISKLSSFNSIQDEKKKSPLTNQNISVDKSYSSSSSLCESEGSLKKNKKIQYKKSSILVTPAKNYEERKNFKDKKLSKFNGKGKKRKSMGSEVNLTNNDLKAKPRKGHKAKSFLHHREKIEPEMNDIYLTPYLSTYRTLSPVSELGLLAAYSPIDSNNPKPFNSLQN